MTDSPSHKLGVLFCPVCAMRNNHAAVGTELQCAGCRATHAPTTSPSFISVGLCCAGERGVPLLITGLAEPFTLACLRCERTRDTTKLDSVHRALLFAQSAVWDYLLVPTRAALTWHPSPAVSRVLLSELEAGNALMHSSQTVMRVVRDELATLWPVVFDLPTI